MISITIKNTGQYAISNEDFKESFSINLKDVNKILYGKVNKYSSDYVLDEVLKNRDNKVIFSDFMLNPNESFNLCILCDSNPKK